MKWDPFTVTSRWLGQPRQNSLCAPVRIVPGPALMNSLGMSLTDTIWSSRRQFPRGIQGQRPAAGGPDQRHIRQGRRQRDTAGDTGGRGRRGPEGDHLGPLRGDGQQQGRSGDGGVQRRGNPDSVQQPLPHGISLRSRDRTRGAGDHRTVQPGVFKTLGTEECVHLSTGEGSKRKRAEGGTRSAGPGANRASPIPPVPVPGAFPKPRGATNVIPLQNNGSPRWRKLRNPGPRKAGN